MKIILKLYMKNKKLSQYNLQIFHYNISSTFSSTCFILRDYEKHGNRKGNNKYNMIHQMIR